MTLEPLEDRTTPAAFTPGDLVVYRVGTGSSLTAESTAVFLDEYNPTTGALVQSIAVPTSSSGGNHALTASGNDASEGMLNLSADGQYLLFTGYDSIPNVSSIRTSNTTGSSPVVRVVGRVGQDGLIDTSTSTTNFDGQPIRSVASSNGIDLWLVGNTISNTDGVVYTTYQASGAGTVVTSDQPKKRTISVAGGQL